MSWLSGKCPFLCRRVSPKPAFLASATPGYFQPIWFTVLVSCVLIGSSLSLAIGEDNPIVPPPPSDTKPNSPTSAPTATPSPPALSPFDSQISDQDFCHCTAIEYCGGCQEDFCCCDSNDRECCWYCYHNSVWRFGTQHFAWSTTGMNLPPLVTLSPDGTPANQVGIIGTPGTQVLFGGGKIFDDARYGSRFLLGYRWDDCSPWGIEGDYLGILRAKEDYFRESTTENIGRPFDNALTGLPDAELVSVPGVLGGSVKVAARTKFNSAGARLKYDVCRCNSPSDASEDTAHQIGLFAGYRFHQLAEKLHIRENLTDPETQGTFDLFDHFNTRNRFHGIEVGLDGLWRRNRWTFEADGGVALGTNYQTVIIDGRTTAQLPDLPADTAAGGLLAQTSNIGVYRRDRFAAIPQFGVSLGYQLWKELRLSVGYRAIIWPHVVRPGDQIDTTVNTNLIPPQAPPVDGPARPRFDFQESRFVAHGISVGLTLDW